MVPPLELFLSVAITDSEVPMHSVLSRCMVVHVMHTCIYELVAYPHLLFMLQEPLVAIPFLTE